ncbi:MAG: hypothetical protein E7288_09290 [Lachnospiraceae bacterium]|nr:hypothetical protein [Lachnospiraceae bacterium]
MATIALNYSPIGQMSGFFEQIKTSISNYQSEILTIQTLSSAVDSTIYNLDDVISEVQTSTTLQDEKIAYIGTLDTQMQTFVDNAVSHDQQAAEEINASKDDFYERYEYLTPDIEQSGWENFWEDVGEWCKEHWVEIVIAVVIIAVAVISIIAIISTGGAALVPLLTAVLSAFGVSAGTAATIAAVVSYTVAAIAIISTVASTILNLVDLFFDMSDNKAFQGWRTAMNWISSISNLFYGAGSIYNGLKGISDDSLRLFTDQMIKTKGAFAGLLGSGDDALMFWSRLGANGDDVAAGIAAGRGKETLAQKLERLGDIIPEEYDDWILPSAREAMKANGAIDAAIGGNGDIWRLYEYSFLRMNPNVESITNVLTGELVERIINGGSIWRGLAGIGQSISSGGSEVAEEAN